MKRMILPMAAAAFVLLALMAGTASADPAAHDKFSVPVDVVFPAGTLCDFTYHLTGTVEVNTTSVSPTGPVSTYQQNTHVTHTNLDTGYALTDDDHTQNIAPLPGSSTAIAMGVFWHLRDASGTLVLVKAGEITYDLFTGEAKFTPNSGFDQTFAQIICTALGGSPA